MDKKNALPDAIDLIGSQEFGPGNDRNEGRCSTLGSKPAWLRYALATGAVGLGWLLRLGFTAWVGEGLPVYITFYPAVFLAALRGGLGPGLLATALASASVAQWITPLGSNDPESTGHLVGLVLFTAMGALIAVLAERWRRGNAQIARLEREVTLNQLTDQAARDLRASENRYRLLIEQVVDGIFVSDAAGRYLDVNQVGAQMLGYTRDEILGLSIADVIVPDEIPRLEGEVARFAGGKVVTSEWRFLRKDGSVFLGEVTGRQLPDGRLQATLRDISERRRMELRLNQERALLASVTAATDVMLGYLDTAFNFVWVNRAYADTCRMTQDEMVGKNHFALYPNEENEAIFRRVKATGEPVFFKDKPFEFPDQPERGVTYWDWSLTAEKDEHGAVLGFVFSLRETTSFVLTQQALHHSDERYHRLFDNMDEGVALYEIVTSEEGWPVDYRFLDVNPAFEHLTGRQRTELIGKQVLELVSGVQGRWLEAFEQVALTGEPAHFEDYVEPRGRWYGAHAYQPAPGQLVVIFSEITEQKAATEALTNAKRAAEMASRAKSAFLANMSHEIRTPLNVIVGLGHLLRSHNDNPTQQVRLDQICSASEHLKAIIDDVLDLSKIEAQAFVLEQNAFRLGGVLDKIVDMLQAQARTRGLTLAVDAAPPVRNLTVIGDALRLTQVLINLGSNAIKFTDQGSVRLSVNCLADDAESVTLSFKVADTGIGIAPADLKRLFHPFIQLDDSSTRERGGTGLGLALSQRMLALMGSRIEVDSQPGAGSVFSFELVLPLAPAVMAEPADVATSPSDTTFPGRRVLCAEDHPVSQEILLEMLEELGCTVDVASDGLEAVACARHGNYDLILMDMQMPRMDGLEAARAIRALPAYRTTPIIALTANAFVEDRQRCLDAGMNGHLGKPVTPSTIAMMLGQWLLALPVPEETTATCDNELTRALARISGLKVGNGMRGSPEQLANYCALLNRFLQRHRQDMAQLSGHLASGDRDAAYRLCHDLKGVAGLIGAWRVSALADQIAETLRGGAGDPVVGEIASQCAAELASLAEAVRALPGSVGETRSADRAPLG